MTTPIEWIYVAVVAGNSILTSGHATKEECFGHRDILQESKIYGQCIQNTVGTSGGVTIPGTNVCYTVLDNGLYRQVCQ